MPRPSIAGWFDSRIRIWRPTVTTDDVGSEIRSYAVSGIFGAAINRSATTDALQDGGTTRVGTLRWYGLPAIDVKPRDLAEVIEGPDAGYTWEVGAVAVHPRGHHTQISCFEWNGRLPIVEEGTDSSGNPIGSPPIDVPPSTGGTDPGTIDSSGNPIPGNGPDDPDEPPGMTLLGPELTGDEEIPTPSPESIAFRWAQNGVGGAHVVADAGGTAGNANALEVLFPPGFVQGSGPSLVYPQPQYIPFAISPAGTVMQELYCRFWYKFSANFPVNLANKCIYVDSFASDAGVPAEGDKGGMFWKGEWDGANPPVYDPFTAPIHPAFAWNGIVKVDGTEIDGYHTPLTEFGPVWPSIQRGVWTKVAFRYRVNSPGLPDSIFKLWINDQLWINYTNRIEINVRQPVAMRIWSMFWTTVYGGGLPAVVPGPPGAIYYHRLKRLKISGKLAGVP